MVSIPKHDLFMDFLSWLQCPQVRLFQNALTCIDKRSSLTSSAGMQIGMEHLHLLINNQLRKCRFFFILVIRNVQCIERITHIYVDLAVLFQKYVATFLFCNFAN